MEIAERIRCQVSGIRCQGINTDLHNIKELLIPFVEKVKRLLILERHAIQSGHLTPLSPPLLRGGWGGNYDPEIQKLRTELFSSSKSHGGLFKELIEELDKLLYDLIKTEATG
ncbi:MAG: hypothetical protein FP832_04185 [Nitrospirae bacterium]|nr:hypothetical protein [Nitrospirota bacterium]